MVRDDIPDLYTPIFDEVTLAVMEAAEPELEKVFDNRTDDSKQVDVSSVTGLGIWESVAEGVGITQEDPVQMYNESFVHDEFGKGFNVTFTALDDDEYAILKKVDNAKAMGVGAMERTETARGDLFNNAFTAAAYAGADGVALCSSTHPKNPNEATTYYDNAITDVFSHAGLEAMETQIAANLRSPKGTIIRMPKTAYIVAGYALQGPIRRVISERAGERPGTPNRDINIYKKGGEGSIDYMPLISQYISSTTAWFIVFPEMGGLGGLRFYWRTKPKYESYIDHTNRRYVFEGSMRYSLGWTGDGWRCVWGSTGA